MLRQHSDPGLALAISDRLLNWRNREELHTIKSLIYNLQAAINSKDILGWDNFCLVLVIKHITAIQQSFLEYLGYISLGEVWMSKVARNIWDIQKQMCGHRNSYVYASNVTIYKNKEEAMTAEIRWEFALGQNGLPTE